MKIEKVTSFVSGEVLQLSDSDRGQVVTGYASLFYKEGDPTTQRESGGVIERILPGAYDGVATQPREVLGLFNHNFDHVLGSTKSGTLKLSTDARGLKYELTLPDTSLAGDLAKLMHRGDIFGSSITFTYSPRDDMAVKQAGGKTIIEFSRARRVWDVGPVSMPAFPAADARLFADNDFLSRRADEMARAAVAIRLIATKADFDKRNVP